MHAPASLQNQHIRISILTAASHKGLCEGFSESMMMMMMTMTMGWGGGGLQRQGRRDGTRKEMEKVGLQIKERENFTLFTRRLPSKQNNPMLSLSLSKKETLARQKKKDLKIEKKPVRERARTENTETTLTCDKKGSHIISNLIKYAYISHTTTRAMCGFSQSPSVYSSVPTQPNPFFLHSSPTQPNPPPPFPPPFLFAKPPFHNNKHPPTPPHIPSPKQQKSTIKENQDEMDFPPRKRK